MPINVIDLEPGLYFVSTPIGNARDITLRALDILASADVIAAEDTRMTRKLMEIHGVGLRGRKIIAFHDHNGERQRPVIVEMLKAGKSVAYASDAGTPMVADPGYTLARDAAAEGLLVTAAPGASALLAGLTVSGLPTDRFAFLGFIPSQASARRRFLEAAEIPDTTLVFFETPKRLLASLAAMTDVFGASRGVVVGRELTKKFETVLRGSLEEVAELAKSQPVKGECVVLLAPQTTAQASDDDIRETLIEMMKTLSVKDSVSATSHALRVNRKTVYQMALSLKDHGNTQ